MGSLTIAYLRPGQSFLRIFLLQVFFLVFVTGIYSQEWEPLGPIMQPEFQRLNDFPSRVAMGTGRVSCVRFEPGRCRWFGKPKHDRIFTGTPYGGLWVSDDDGMNWKRFDSGDLPNSGISDYVTDPSDNTVRYLVTGDPDCILDPNQIAMGSEMCQSRGIMKSPDGGKTWKGPIGNWYDDSGKLLNDFWKFPSGKVVRKLLALQGSVTTLLTIVYSYNNSPKGFDGFVFRSTDGGMNWTMTLRVADGYLKDLEKEPARQQTVYSCGRSLFKSEDGGMTWKKNTLGGLPPDSMVARIELALTAAFPGRLYALVVLKNAKFSELYISNDHGEHFATSASAPASPEWRTALAASPADASLIFFSSGNKVNRFVYDGNTWKYKYTGAGVHDDIHDLTFDPEGKKIFASSDGGLYVSSDSGSSWNFSGEGINSAECWSISMTRSGPLKIISGLQDCGTIIYYDTLSGANKWKITRGGDGMAVAFDPNDTKIVYANDGNNNILSRSDDGGITWSGNLAASRGHAAYLRPFCIDPNRPEVIYSGYHDLFRSYDRGESWQKAGDFSIASPYDWMIDIRVAQGDSERMYVAFNNAAWKENPTGKLFRTDNGGVDWKDISGGLLGAGYSQITCIAVNPENKDDISIGFRGGGKFKAMQSMSGGLGNNPWKDISEGLDDDADVNCLMYDPVNSGRIFAGTHIGVFVRMANPGKWSAYGKGLPRVMVSALDIRPNPGILVAGTHGNGVWRVPIK